jgi:hypothetical protein
MHRHGNTVQMEVKIYATNLANKSSPRKSMHNNEWRFIETNLVPTAIAIYRAKPQ